MTDPWTKSARAPANISGPKFSFSALESEGREEGTTASRAGGDTLEAGDGLAEKFRKENERI